MNGAERCDDCGEVLDDDGLCPHCFDYERYIDAGAVQCPDCGAPLEELYERAEQTPTTVVGWCPESGESKSVPKREREVRTDTDQDGGDT